MGGRIACLIRLHFLHVKGSLILKTAAVVDCTKKSE